MKKIKHSEIISPHIIVKYISLFSEKNKTNNGNEKIERSLC
jgi:hypothetical protein